MSLQARNRQARRWRRPWSWVVALAAATACAGLGVALAGSGAPPAHRAAERVIGQTGGSTRVSFSLVLHVGQSRLRQFMAGLYDPHSRFYRHFINAHAFGRRFGISDRELGQLRRTLTQDGVRITAEYPQLSLIHI